MNFLPVEPFKGLLPLLLTAVAVRTIASYSFYLYDDAFITFRIVENLVNGAGFTYNPGERVQGLSAPLWGLLLTIPRTVHIPLEWAARLFAVVADLLCMTLVWRVMRVSSGTVAAVVGVFLFAADLYLVKTAMGGMESSLFLLLTVWAAVLWLERKHTAAAIVAGLSVFARPEGLLFATAIILYSAVAERRVPVKAIVIGAAVIAVGAVFQFLYYGGWIPQSVRGKWALPDAPFDVLTLALFPRMDPLQSLLTVTTLAGLPIAWKRSRFARLYGVWIALLLAAWIITRAHLWTWYCVPVWMYKLVVTGIAAGVLIETKASLGKLKSLLRPALLSAVMLAAWGTLAVVYGRERMDTHVYSRIRNWSAGKALDDSRAYAVDFGAFGYYTKMKILDEPGLVWPAAIDRYRSDLIAILLAERPEYAYISVNRAHLAAMRSDSLARLYVPLWRASMTGDTVVYPSLDSVTAGWEPDFMLFRRRDVNG